MDYKPGNSDKCPIKLTLSRNFKQEENLNISYPNLTHPYLFDSLTITKRSPIGAIYRCERYYSMTKNIIKDNLAFQ
jgi:hypothetical protein